MIPKLALLSLSLPLISALGCYTEGAKFSDLKNGPDYDNVDDSIQQFCKYIIAGPFNPNGTLAWCYQFDNHYIMVISVTNTGTSAATLNAPDCFTDFEIERSACVYGSRQQYGDFLLDIDPNYGDCPGP